MTQIDPLNLILGLLAAGMSGVVIGMLLTWMANRGRRRRATDVQGFTEGWLEVHTPDGEVHGWSGKFTGFKEWSASVDEQLTTKDVTPSEVSDESVEDFLAKLDVLDID